MAFAPAGVLPSAASSPDELLNRPLSLVVALALVGLLPFLLMTLTSFVKISTVLHIARSAIGAPEASIGNGEGLFFPDTYLFDKNTSDLDVYRRAYRLMRVRLDEAWLARAPNLPYKTPYEALIMASIIEKETGKKSDRPMVAAVFANRLRVGMPLQTDPTVIYGMGESYAGRIRKKDLQTDTPYNTYTRMGLPPTPISLPGVASLQAAMNPAQTSALYFVSRGDGSSIFSDNLGDHNKAVDKYIRGQ